jgi:phospholipid-transporting ATPase
MIPISLFVTIEIARLLQAFFMVWDNDMRAGPENSKMRVRNSNLNEELGNVRIGLTSASFLPLVYFFFFFCA